MPTAANKRRFASRKVVFVRPTFSKTATKPIIARRLRLSLADFARGTTPPNGQDRRMWIVSIALKRPYTFIVMALMILLATPYMLLTMATDILPEINIPVISIIWNYNGLSAQEMGKRITARRAHPDHHGQRHRAHRIAVAAPASPSSRSSSSPAPTSPTAIAQVVAIEQTHAARAAAGHHAAADHQVFGLEHPGDPARPVRARPCRNSRCSTTAINFLRPQLVTIPGVAIPCPYGGKQRLISVDLDTAGAARATGLSPHRRGQRASTRRT